VIYFALLSLFARLVARLERRLLAKGRLSLQLLNFSAGIRY
jgi:hypothetical protein